MTYCSIGGIEPPQAAAVASGVVFGRTAHVAADEEQAFLVSGLWHLRRGVLDAQQLGAAGSLLPLSTTHA